MRFVMGAGAVLAGLVIVGITFLAGYSAGDTHRLGEYRLQMFTDRTSAMNWETIERIERQDWLELCRSAQMTAKQAYPVAVGFTLKGHYDTPDRSERVVVLRCYY